MKIISRVNSRCFHLNIKYSKIHPKNDFQDFIWTPDSGETNLELDLRIMFRVSFGKLTIKNEP